MSYDISVLNPEGGSVNKMDLVRRLAEAGWRADSENHFLWEVAEGVFADMDLAWAQNSEYAEPTDKVNCLQVHIPYGLIESSRPEVLQQCRKLAEVLGWQAYDEQEGTYLR